MIGIYQVVPQKLVGPCWAGCPWGPTSPPPCPALTEVVTGKSLQKHRAIKYILNYHGLSNLKAQSHEILRTL